MPKTSLPHRCSHRALAAILGLVLVGGLAGSAVAQTRDFDPYEPSPLPFAAPGAGPILAAPPLLAPEPVRRWYGYQLMVGDIVAIALLFTGQSGAGAGALTFFVAPPVIHGMHHNVPMAVASPLMRTLLPVVGAVIGASAESCSSSSEDDWCGLGGALAGLGLGLLTAMILDYSLAWEESAPTPVARAPQRPSRLTLTTAGVAPTGNGASFVLGGRF